MPWWLHWRIPINSFLVILIILFCELLVSNHVIEYQTDVFLAPWFNCAGFLVHTLPNIILFAVVAIPIELSVGSLNFFLQWFMGLYFMIPYGYFKNGSIYKAVCGSSTQVYFQFTVFGGAIFLSKFLYPALDKSKTNSRKWQMNNASNILKSISWWVLGILLLFCAGWFLNGLIQLAVIIAKKAELMPSDMNPDDYVHNVFCGMGYFGTLLLSILLWYQNPMDNNNLIKDCETKFGVFRIVWIKRQFKTCENNQVNVSSSSNSDSRLPKICSVIPFCQEFLLILGILFCVGFGTLMLYLITTF